MVFLMDMYTQLAALLPPYPHPEHLNLVGRLYFFREDWGLVAAVMAGFFFMILTMRKDPLQPILQAMGGIITISGPVGLLLDYVYPGLPTGIYNDKSVIAAFLVGGALWWVVTLYLVSQIERLKAKITTNTQQSRLAKTDVRTVTALMPSTSKPYNPEKYFKMGSVFIGLDENRKPIYIEYPKIGAHPHLQVAGTTGGGKGGRYLCCTVH